MPFLSKLAAAAALALIAAPACAALKAGDPAPRFSAPAYLAGTPFNYSLDEALKHGPVVVYFFPTEHCGGKFPVAADPGAKIAREYETTLDKKPEWSSRTSYVIAPSGAISAVYSDLNPNRHVQEMLDAVKALHAHQPD